MSIRDWGKTYGVTPSVLFNWRDRGGGPVPGLVAPAMSDKIKKKIEEQEALSLTPQEMLSKRASE
jgi:hypothetical protein